jgi:hypothetical protein
MPDIGLIITIIAALPLVWGITKAKELLSPLRNFWKSFLREGGIIVIPPYPKKRPDYSVKSGTGYSDCIAAGEIRGALGSLGAKAVEIKEEINDTDRKNNLIVIGGPRSNREYNGVTEKEQSPFEFNKELFCWKNVPGNDSERLLMYLRSDYAISWVESAQIRKSNDGKTICIFNEENSAKITIDEQGEKAVLTIRDGRTIDLKVKTENGKLNIYNKDNYILKDGKKYKTSDEKTGYGLFYVLHKTRKFGSENQMVVLIAGCYGADTIKLAEMLTNKWCIKQIIKRINSDTVIKKLKQIIKRIKSDKVMKKYKYASTVFVLRYNKDTSPDHIIENSERLP